MFILWVEWAQSRTHTRTHACQPSTTSYFTSATGERANGHVCVWQRGGARQCESEINDNKLRNLNYLVEPDALQVWDDDDNNTLHITANITHTHTQTHKPIERTTISEMVMMFVIKQQA